LDGLHYRVTIAGAMHAHEDDRPFSDFILRWWEEGDRLHENPSFSAGAASDAVRSESSPIWLFAVWASLVSLLVLTSL
jgi:hypothetical protein